MFIFPPGNNVKKVKHNTTSLLLQNLGKQWHLAYQVSITTILFKALNTFLIDVPIIVEDAVNLQ